MTGKRLTPAQAVDRLVDLAQSTLSDSMTSSEQAGFDRLPLREPRRRTRWFALGLGLGLAAVSLPLVLLFLHKEPGLSFKLTTAAPSPAARPGRIDFSDGSSVVMADGARAAVGEMGAHGARVLLESGRLHTDFVPMPSARWSVDAGPYRVSVTGTTFDIAWIPSEQRMEIWLFKGGVLVKGPLAEPGIAMSAGQHLSASGITGQIVLDQIEKVALPPEQPPSVQPAAPTPIRPREGGRHPSPVRIASTREPPSPAPELSWSQLLARGDIRRILDQAEEHGIERTLATAGSADLAALADAARYMRQDPLAIRVLLAERKRFPQTMAGNDAAFFLGGVYEGRADAGSQRSALEWYDRYLREAATGSYAAQAMGRKLLVLERLHEDARSAAAEYLHRYPGGAYVATARRLLDSRQ
jgi:hypothetical protein